MIIIEYCEDTGIPLSDGAVEGYVKDKINGILDNDAIVADIRLTFCNGLAIDHVRLMIAEGAIKHTDITFCYKGIEIKSDKHANLSEWPEGFCGRYYRCPMEIIRCKG